MNEGLGELRVSKTLFYVGRSADKTENLLVLKQGSTGGFSLEFLSLFD